MVILEQLSDLGMYELVGKIMRGLPHRDRRRLLWVSSSVRRASLEVIMRASSKTDEACAIGTFLSPGMVLIPNLRSKPTTITEEDESADDKARFRHPLSKRLWEKPPPARIFFESFPSEEEEVSMDFGKANKEEMLQRGDYFYGCIQNHPTTLFPFKTNSNFKTVWKIDIEWSCSMRRQAWCVDPRGNMFVVYSKQGASPVTFSNLQIMEIGLVQLSRTGVAVAAGRGEVTIGSQLHLGVHSGRLALVTVSEIFIDIFIYCASSLNLCNKLELVAPTTRRVIDAEVSCTLTNDVLLAWVQEDEAFNIYAYSMETGGLLHCQAVPGLRFLGENKDGTRYAESLKKQQHFWRLPDEKLDDEVDLYALAMPRTLKFLWRLQMAKNEVIVCSPIKFKL